MSAQQPDEIEKLGLLYDVAINQQQAAQDAVKSLVGVTATLTTQEKAVRDGAYNGARDGLAAMQTEAIKDAGAVATAAAVEFEGLAKAASQEARQAASVARRAASGVAWWIFAVVFLSGLALGSAGLWLLYPRPEPYVKVYIDAGKAGKGEIRACAQQ